MRIINFTGQIPNFVGGFSGFSPAASSGIPYITSTYKFTGSLQATSETSPTGIWFKPDGTKLFVVGSTQDRLKSWDLTTAWDINSATNFTNMAGTLLTNAGVALTLPTGVSFSNDGTKCFVTDGTNNALYRYSLTTAWDITSLNTTADQVNTTIYTANLTPQSIWVKPDGLGFLTANSGATAEIRYWTSAVANDITTLTAAANVSAANTQVGANWVDNGLKLIFLAQATDNLVVNRYTPAYTFSGGGTFSQLTVTSYDTTPQDIYMLDDGSRFYYLGSATDTIYQFTL